MKLTIKHTTGIELNGNKMSGNTYPVKGYISAYLGGKWDKDGKCWIVDVNKVNDLIAKQCVHIDNSQPVQETVTGSNGWCNKCHSYCYGDCQAHG